MGFRYAFVAATVISIIGLVLVFLFKESKNQYAAPVPA
jgi:hypothetical protein